jgi:hypothetical protein
MTVVYVTEFDPVTKAHRGHSTPTGFASVREVQAVLGPAQVATASYAIFPEGVVFSHFPFKLAPPEARDIHV